MDKESHLTGNLKFINLSLLLAISILCFGYVYSLNKNLSENLHYKYTDLVYFEQSLANFIDGHGLVNTGRGEERSLFSEHAYFTHFLISLPFYALFPNTLTLFNLGTIHVLAGLIIVFFLARRRLENAALAWVCYFAFLMNGFVQFNAGGFWRYGFHAEVFYLAYFLLFLYFWDRNKKIAVLAFFLALLTKETYFLPLFLTMLYFLIKQKGKKKTIIILMAISLFYFLLATKFLIPFFGSGKTAYNYYALNFQALKSVNLKNFLDLFLNYWKALFLHFQFLPLLSPQIVILALPDSLINVLSRFILNYRVPANPASWHSIPVYGFLIWAYIESFRRLTGLLKKKVFIYLFSLVIVFFSVFLFQYSPIHRLSHFRANQTLLSSLDTAKKMLARSDSLCLEWDLGAPFMKKRYLYNFPKNCRKSEYLLFRPSARNFRKIKDVRYEITFQSPRLILLKNLDYQVHDSLIKDKAVEKKQPSPPCPRPERSELLRNSSGRYRGAAGDSPSAGPGGGMSIPADIPSPT